MKALTKQRAVAVARGIGLLPLLEAGRFMRDKWATAEENAQFRRDHPDFAPPPLWWMHDMYSQTSFEKYWRLGKSMAETMAAAILLHTQLENPRVADWGCGLARVLRHMPSDFQRVGFDYNDAAIKWGAEHIAGVEFHKSDLMPPLPAADEAFDALYAVSVFTHLSEAAHHAWMEEIKRVLAPNGVFLGTFHMTPSEDQLLTHEKERFDAGELVVRGAVKEGTRIFTAHHPERYLREKLLRDFEIVEGPSDFYGQTMFVARKT